MIGPDPIVVATMRYERAQAAFDRALASGMPADAAMRWVICERLAVERILLRDAVNGIEQELPAIFDEVGRTTKTLFQMMESQR